MWIDFWVGSCVNKGKRWMAWTVWKVIEWVVGEAVCGEGGSFEIIIASLKWKLIDTWVFNGLAAQF